MYWAEFIKLSKRFGHRVTIVTIRNEKGENSEIEGFALDNNIGVVYTNGKQKSTMHNADVWIDDMPLSIPSDDAMRAVTRLIGA